MERIAKKSPEAGDLLLWLAGAVATVLWLGPLAWTIVSSVKPEGEILTRTPEFFPHRFALDHYRTILQQPILRWFINSTAVAIGGTFLTICVSATAGYALSLIHI